MNSDEPLFGEPHSAYEDDATRSERLVTEIDLWLGNHLLEAVLRGAELARLPETIRRFCNNLIVAAIKHCRLNPRADSRMPLLVLITFLSINEEGICRLSVTKLCLILQRSREAIVGGIKSLEEQAQIGVHRISGMPNCYWPLMPRALATLSIEPAWLVNAVYCIASGRELPPNPSTPVDRSPGVNRSTPPDGGGQLSSSSIPPLSSGYDAAAAAVRLAVPRPATPHLTNAGFIISAERGLVIPVQTVSEWRERFPHIPDLEAAMQGLAATMLSKGPMHPGWTCAEGWMAGVLSKMNREAAHDAGIAAARKARAVASTSGSRNGLSSRSAIDAL
jgi:hypothetical protein